MNEKELLDSIASSITRYCKECNREYKINDYHGKCPECGDG